MEIQNYENIFYDFIKKLQEYNRLSETESEVKKTVRKIISYFNPVDADDSILKYSSIVNFKEASEAQIKVKEIMNKCRLEHLDLSHEAILGILIDILTEIIISSLKKGISNKIETSTNQKMTKEKNEEFVFNQNEEVIDYFICEKTLHIIADYLIKFVNINMNININDKNYYFVYPSFNDYCIHSYACGEFFGKGYLKYILEKCFSQS
mgnify:CR=1 FL=1